MDNPAWIQARRDEANGLVRMLRQNLPGMRTFAEQLRANAADAGMPATALGALGIVQDRLEKPSRRCARMTSSRS